MSRYTKDDIFRMVEEEDVEFIRLQFTDIFGTLKNIAITSSQLEKALDNKCMFDGSSVEGFVRIEESDMYLYPDYDTFEIFPWRPQQGKVARLICDVYTPDGKPFEGDPRWILKKTIKEANEMGYRFDVGPECEFFLFHTDDNGLPTTLSHEKAGYFDLGPNDLGENIRRDMDFMQHLCQSQSLVSAVLECILICHLQLKRVRIYLQMRMERLVYQMMHIILLLVL